MNPREYAQEQCLLAEALLQQAESTREGERFLDALDCYQAAIEIDPDYPESYLALAYLWLSQGHPDQAYPFAQSRWTPLTPNYWPSGKILKQVHTQRNLSHDRSQQL